MYAGEYEFITEQIELYGQEYVDQLIERGFVAVHTNQHGWIWMLDSLSANQARTLNEVLSH